MKRTMIAISVVAALLAAVSLAMAWGPGAGRGMSKSPGLAGCWYGPNVNLTAEQREKLTGMQQEFVKDTLPIRNELASKSMEFRSMMIQPAPDAAKASAKQQEIFALRQKLQEKTLAFQLNARKVLTPEQLSSLPMGGFGSAPGAAYGSRHKKGYSPMSNMGRGMGSRRAW